MEREALELRVRDAGLMDLVPFRSWILDSHRPMLAHLDVLGDDGALHEPAPGLPSAFEVLRHLVPLRRRIARICSTLEHGEQPDLEGHRTISTLPSMAWARMALDSSQDELTQVLDQLWPMTDLDLRIAAWGIGPYNCKEWLAWQRLHDEEHLAEIEEAAYLLGVHGSQERAA